jgi:hypothetical protein
MVAVKSKIPTGTGFPAASPDWKLRFGRVCGRERVDSSMDGAFRPAWAGARTKRMINAYHALCGEVSHVDISRLLDGIGQEAGLLFE